MKKLISMVAFVLQETKLWSGNEYESYEIAKSCLKYAQFLIQKLELWMFVPCKLVDGVWIALEKPEFPKYENRRAHDGLAELYDFQLKEYEEAKERCLFEGFKIKVYNGRSMSIILVIRSFVKSNSFSLTFSSSVMILVF